MMGNGVRLRRRATALPVLEASDVPPAPTHLIVRAAGVHVDLATARAASWYAQRHDLDALDLVPADLPVERLLDLLWLTDPARLRDEPLARARGALSALLLTEDLAERLGVEAVTELSPLEMLHLTARAKRYAPRSTEIAVAPDLRAAAGPGPGAGGGRACLAASFSIAAPIVVGTKAAALALLARGVTSRRPTAVAAVVAHALVPMMATGGTALAPRDLPGRVPLRLVNATLDLGRTLVGRRTGPTDDREATELAARRAEYDQMLAGGLDAFFEPRCDDCPLCGSTALELLLRTPDMNQAKPGEFCLDRCRACGHVFQNPCLTPAGLDFYYRDFYDGLGEDHAELVFGAGVPSYRGRAELVEGVAAEPRRWLDVGAGHGHFCLLARSIWPKTTFDGLEMAASIDEAARRGWVDTGWRGAFPALAPELAGAYDVVSMHHYLEHTRAPLAELDAARTVLEPGGLLLIEMPDASSWLGRRLGRFWAPWLQPQHLHFLTVERLTALLEERGFTTLAVQRREPHQPAELLLAAYLALNQLAPPVDVPWRPPSTRAERWRRGAVLGLAAPLFVAALAADVLMAPVLRRTGASNAYRVLARAPVDRDRE
jgi:SAM-dependent methyltransferase